MKLSKYLLGDLIQQRREKNSFDGLPICGVTRDGFIPPKQQDADTSLYNVFYKGDFVFNPARMELNSIVFNDTYDKAICSSLYGKHYFYAINCSGRYPVRWRKGFIMPIRSMIGI